MRALIQKLIKDELDKENIYCRVAEVISVDDTERTCVVKILGEIVETPAVKLQSDIENTEGIYIKPKIGSYVVIGFVNKEAAFVALYGEIDEIIINGGKNDGIVKVNPLVSALNKRSDRENAIVTSLQALATACTGVGSTPLTGAALGALINTAISTITTPVSSTIKSDLENTKVKH